MDMRDTIVHGSSGVSNFVGMETILPPTQISFSYGQGGINRAIDLVEGNNYTVFWDGVEYPDNIAIAVAEQGIDAVCIGNPQYVGGEDNGLPFLVVVIKGTNQTGFAGGATLSTVEIIGVANKLQVSAGDKVFNAPFTELKTIELYNGIFIDNEHTNPEWDDKDCRFDNIECPALDLDECIVSFNGVSLLCEVGEKISGDYTWYTLRHDGAVMLCICIPGATMEFSTYQIEEYVPGFTESLKTDGAHVTITSPIIETIAKLESKYLPDTLYVMAPDGNRYPVQIDDGGYLFIELM